MACDIDLAKHHVIIQSTGQLIVNNPTQVNKWQIYTKRASIVI